MKYTLILKIEKGTKIYIIKIEGDKVSDVRSRLDKWWKKVEPSYLSTEEEWGKWLKAQWEVREDDEDKGGK